MITYHAFKSHSCIGWSHSHSPPTRWIPPQERPLDAAEGPHHRSEHWQWRERMVASRQSWSAIEANSSTTSMTASGDQSIIIFTGGRNSLPPRWREGSSFSPAVARRTRARARTHTHAHTRTHTRAHACARTHERTRTHTRHAHAQTNARTTRTHARMHHPLRMHCTPPHARTHECIRTHTHIRTHMQ